MNGASLYESDVVVNESHVLEESENDALVNENHVLEENESGALVKVNHVLEENESDALVNDNRVLMYTLDGTSTMNHFHQKNILEIS